MSEPKKPLWYVVLGDDSNSGTMRFVAGVVVLSAVLATLVWLVR